MSFQHFRLGDITMHPPIPPHPHLVSHQQPVGGMSSAPSPAQFSGQTVPTAANTTTFVNNTGNNISPTSGQPKQPYGSGDIDDGYTLLFSDIDAFNAWRLKEEETLMVEFVKGDTHGSKAVPPRFKDHTKLVCARHSRSGRKKYVKKHPERVRKVPSRKLEGTGCPASISFKTYFNTEEVRACYNSQHSHEVGVANLPYTRRGRKAAAQDEKEKQKKSIKFHNETAAVSEPAAPVPPQPEVPPTPHQTQYSSAVALIAPLPGSTPFMAPTQAYYHSAPYGMQPQSAVTPAFTQDRWDNMATLFHSVREHSRTFEYPLVSVAALESCLIRLFLESPNAGIQPGMMVHQPPPTAVPTNGVNGGAGRTDNIERSASEGADR